MKTVAEAIAESTRSGGFARLKVPVWGVGTILSLAESAARDAGLGVHRIATREGFYVVACREGEPDLWRVSIHFDFSDNICEGCHGSGMAIRPFGKVAWCDCGPSYLNDDPPEIPAAWHHVKKRIDRRMAGLSEDDDGTTLWDELSWPVVAASALWLKEAGQW